MEEAIWILSPIAVAVLAYLLDVRSSRRHEADMDSLRERFHRVEMAYVSQFADMTKSEAIQDITLAQHGTRLDVLEGGDGVSKDEGDKLKVQMENLHSNIVSLAIGHNELKGKVDAMVAVEDDE